MKQITLKLIAPALCYAGLLTVASCSSEPKPPPPKSEFSGNTEMEHGVPGRVVVETHTVTANIIKIDKDAREVVLAIPDGKEERVKCGPEIVNFDQLRVGDQVKVMVAEELAVYMASETAPPEAGAAAMVALAPKGGKPGGVMVATKQVVATVVGIDLVHHMATLQTPDGRTTTIAVRPDVDLTKRKIGERVVIRKTEALAISVEKP